MDAVKFIEERNRMCKSVGDACTGCPAFNVCEDNLCCCAVDIESTMDATAQVAIVEGWSDAGSANITIGSKNLVMERAFITASSRT